MAFAEFFRREPSSFKFFWEEIFSKVASPEIFVFSPENLFLFGLEGGSSQLLS